MTAFDILVMISIAVVVFVIWRKVMFDPAEDFVVDKDEIKREIDSVFGVIDSISMSTTMHRDQLKEFSDSYLDGMTEAIHAYNFSDDLPFISGSCGGQSSYYAAQPYHEHSKFVSDGRRCVYCRTLNPADHRSCDKCGAPL